MQPHLSILTNATKHSYCLTKHSPDDKKIYTHDQLGGATSH